MRTCKRCKKEMAVGEGFYFPEGDFCLKCGPKILKEAREKHIKENPCPFKVIGHREIIDAYAEPETIKKAGTPYINSESRTVCKLMPFNPTLDTCVGEKNCPIYNGGIK